MSRGDQASVPAGEVAYRDLGPDDAASLSALHGLAFARGWAPGELAAFAVEPASVGVVAVDPGGRTIGFALARVAADEAEILTLAVHPRSRRRGVARQLIEHLARRVASRGALRLHLEVAVDNGAARALYRRLGFRETGRRRDYYIAAGGAAVDAATMTLELPTR